MTDLREKWEDQRVDRALDEVLGDSAPPDLTERILRAAAEQEVESLGPDTAPTPKISSNDSSAKENSMQASPSVSLGHSPKSYVPAIHDSPLSRYGQTLPWRNVQASLALIILFAVGTLCIIAYVSKFPPNFASPLPPVQNEGEQERDKQEQPEIEGTTEQALAPTQQDGKATGAEQPEISPLQHYQSVKKKWLAQAISTVGLLAALDKVVSHYELTSKIEGLPRNDWHRQEALGLLKAQLEIEGTRTGFEKECWPELKTYCKALLLKHIDDPSAPENDTICQELIAGHIQFNAVQKAYLEDKASLDLLLDVQRHLRTADLAFAKVQALAAGQSRIVLLHGVQVKYAQQTLQIGNAVVSRRKTGIVGGELEQEAQAWEQCLLFAYEANELLRTHQGEPFARSLNVPSATLYLSETGEWNLQVGLPKPVPNTNLAQSATVQNLILTQPVIPSPALPQPPTIPSPELAPVVPVNAALAATGVVDQNGEPVVCEPVCCEPVCCEPVCCEPVCCEPTLSEPTNESYTALPPNPFHNVTQTPQSTFSIDVDTAAYSNIRRFLEQWELPSPDAVRIEEMINYFSYTYPRPSGPHPFSVNLEVATCPWQPKHKLVRIGLKGKEIKPAKRPPSNLVFLVDVSGSMGSPNKLPLVKDSLRRLVKKLIKSKDSDSETGKDTIAMVVYASSTGLVLDSTKVTRQSQAQILAAINRLEAGGSTHGSAGITQAYKVARRAFIKEGVNRVILCTDGDFNVGITSSEALEELIQQEARSNVFLTVLGFGMGNLKGNRLELLANKGNGNYGYIDSEREAKKIFDQQLSGTLVTIAKDVKIQVEFNPAEISTYRLIGYENRVMPNQDFNDDTKDAGEIGAGHTVTALYELVPASLARTEASKLKYQPAAPVPPADASTELLTVSLRYKPPTGTESLLFSKSIERDEVMFSKASQDFQWASGIALMGMMLRGNEDLGELSWNSIQDILCNAQGEDEHGHRAECLRLIDRILTLEGTNKSNIKGPSVKPTDVKPTDVKKD